MRLVKLMHTDKISKAKKEVYINPEQVCAVLVEKQHVIVRTQDGEVYTVEALADHVAGLFCGSAGS